MHIRKGKKGGVGGVSQREFLGVDERTKQKDTETRNDPINWTALCIPDICLPRFSRDVQTFAPINRAELLIRSTMCMHIPKFGKTRQTSEAATNNQLANLHSTMQPGSWLHQLNSSHRLICLRLQWWISPRFEPSLRCPIRPPVQFGS